ncbi:MAG TPA: ATP-binding cassette domain-containing protein [Ignavibacteriaceae bacterium]|nr:ATP-binding cassette domain-containing protein [Ignavibacteriaceae bacterium]
MKKLLSVENISHTVETSGKDLNLFTSRGLRHIGIADNASRKELLKNISFSLDDGEIGGIAGESGGGKTTLAKIIAGIIKPSAGSINFYSAREHKKQKANPIQILFQNNGEILNPLRRINEVVEEALSINLRRTGKAPNKKIISEEREKIFSAVNFPEILRERKGFELSGGEQQRAALARILAADPELLILDEPFSSQDPESQINFLELFKKINMEFGTAMICISHNLEILRNLCSKVLIIYNGEIVESGPAAEVLNAPKHPYTKYLLKAEEYNLSHEELKQNFA